MTVRLFLCGVPKGIRTPVTAVKGRCPRPLDDGDRNFFYRNKLDKLRNLRLTNVLSLHKPKLYPNDSFTGLGMP